MNLRSWLFGISIGFCAPLLAQPEVDVTKLVADTKTFIFDDQKHTVKSYIYAELEAKTSCCGTDRIYLEVKIDPSGHVLLVKPLTGKNECLKNAAADIVQNIKWDTREFKGAKSVYFEIKPEINCEGRENVYAKLPVFNNPLINAEGVAVPTTVAATPPAQPTPTPTQPAPTQPVVVTPAQPQTAPAVVPPTTPAPSKSTPATQPAQDPAKTAAVTPMTATAPANPTAVQPSAEQEEQRRREEAQRLADEQELQRLKEQMQKMREAEEKKRLEAPKAAPQPSEAQVARGNTTRKPAAAEGRGGLFLDGGDDDQDDPKNKKPAQTTPPAPVNEEDRIRQEIQQLEEQKRKIEEAKRTRMEDLRRRQQEEQKDNTDLVRIEEEILRKQEEAAQRREQQELDRLAQEQRKAEDDRRRSEEEYQRMQDEIRRLQDEAQRKIDQLERQKMDLDRIAQLSRAREQEIQLERTLRDQESQRRIEEIRLSLMGSGASIALVSDDNSNGTMLSSSLPALTTREDSNKLLALYRTIDQMRGEMQRLQEQIVALGGTPATPIIKSQTTPAKTRTPSQTSASTDRSWEKLEYRDPKADPSIYTPQVTTPVRPYPQPSATNPTTPARPATTPGQQPAPAQDDTHANLEGPKFEQRTYVGGNEKLKEAFQSRMKAAGVCGLAQCVFSVTLDPAGNVVRHTVLAANSPVVEMQMAGFLPTLKFNPINSRYNQTVYLEFKTEVFCEGTSGK
ncbi:MAG: hypothetical protein SF053_07080 [Bacteroidia bacterium]|nr:hypothetical protein [Bacteroidia bacterium]